jgi:hypothetical protein
MPATNEQKDALLKQIADGFPLGEIPHADTAWALARGKEEFPDPESADDRAYVRNRWVSIVAQAIQEKEEAAKAERGQPQPQPQS